MVADALGEEERSGWMRFQGGRKLSFGLQMSSARKKGQVGCVSCYRMEVELYGELSTSSGRVSVALSPTLVGRSAVVGVMDLTRFQLYQ